MKTKFFGKFGNIIRRAFCGMLCLCLIFQGYQFASADVGNSYRSYEWTRMSSFADMQAYIEKGKTDQDAERRITSGHDLVCDNEDGWFKALIVYKTNGQYYFFSGSSQCNDNQSICASRVLETYGFKIGENKFTTDSGYYTPYIKFAGYDDTYDYLPMFYLRPCGNRTEDLGSNLFVGNMSWYGVTYHACSASQIHLTTAVNPTGHDYGKACNWSINKAFTMHWSRGLFQASYSVPSSADRWWAYKDNYEVYTKKSPSSDESSFYLYIGREVPSQAISSKVVLQSGYTTTYNNITLQESGSITVPKNSYLVIDGDNNKNNGRIVVEGGTLIIKGVLDSKQAVSGSPSDLGSIELSDGATLIVEDTGLIVGRSATAHLYLTGGSVAVISGSCAIGGEIKIEDSSLFIREGGAMIHGGIISGTVSASTISKDKLYKSRFNYLDSVVSFNSADALNKSTTTAGKLYVTGQSTLQGYGMYFRAPNTGITIQESTAVDYKESNNGYAQIWNMMRNW